MKDKKIISVESLDSQMTVFWQHALDLEAPVHVIGLNDQFVFKSSVVDVWFEFY